MLAFLCSFISIMMSRYFFTWTFLCKSTGVFAVATVVAVRFSDSDIVGRRR